MLHAWKPTQRFDAISFPFFVQSMENASEILPKMLKKIAESIRLFRGYIDKDRFYEDIEFLLEFLSEAGHAGANIRKTA